MPIDRLKYSLDTLRFSRQQGNRAMIAIAKGLLGRLPGSLSLPWSLLLGTMLLIVQLNSQHLDSRLYLWLTSLWQTAPITERSLKLAEYQVSLEARPVIGIENNLSGLSYDPQRDQLWAVTNGPPELLALSKNGELLERYPLEGFEDVEAVAYIGEGRLVVVEERRQSLVVLNLPAHVGVLRRDDFPSLTLALGVSGNKGFEGLDYDPKGDRLFVAKERDPRQLYEIQGLFGSRQGDMQLKVRDRSAWLEGTFVRDLSSLLFDPRSGHLVLLSDESKALLELSEEGQMVGFRSLLYGFAGLSHSVPQAEGVTLDSQGNLYVVSEPNLFYRFQRD